MPRLLLLGLLLVLSAFAQYDTASVLGTVTIQAAPLLFMSKSRWKTPKPA